MNDGQHEDTEKQPIGQGTDSTRPRSRAGRPPTHNLTSLRKAVTRLSTRRLDGRSTVAVAARRFKADLTADLGGDPSRAQATLIELAARTWIMVEALDDWLMRQPSLVLHRKRTVLPVLLQRQQMVDSLARLLERLGLERKARDVTDLQTYLATRSAEGRSPSRAAQSADPTPDSASAPDSDMPPERAGLLQDRRADVDAGPPMPGERKANGEAS